MAARFSPPNPVFMRRAVAEALEHLRDLAGGPFGACLVQGDEILAVAYNTVLQDRDPTCHAEMNAIRMAAAKLQTYDLSGCEIYTTTEPCPMCFAAIHWARLRRVIYGTTIQKAASLGFNEITIGIQQMQNLGKSPVVIYPAFLLAECQHLLESWAEIPDRQVY